MKKYVNKGVGERSKKAKSSGRPFTEVNGLTVHAY